MEKQGDCLELTCNFILIQTEPYIVQKYIMNPLLFGMKKFDMRIYVLVTNYNPLTVYFYRNGFARFTHEPYDDSDVENLCK